MDSAVRGLQSGGILEKTVEVNSLNIYIVLFCLETE